MILVDILTAVLATYIGSAFAYSSVMARLLVFSPTRGPERFGSLNGGGGNAGCSLNKLATEYSGIMRGEWLYLSPPNTGIPESWLMGKSRDEKVCAPVVGVWSLNAAVLPAGVLFAHIRASPKLSERLRFFSAEG
jgi:hypothetical protein